MDTPTLDQAKLEAFATRAVGDIAAAYTGVMGAGRRGQPGLHPAGLEHPGVKHFRRAAGTPFNLIFEVRR